MAKVAAEVGSTANSYQILAKLAAGGMAEIFLARGAAVAGVERYCVLKRILRERASDAQFVQMFLDEARLAAQLQHPNIASVYDIGMLGDSYFFTMEYVHGETVRSLLQRAQGLRRPLPLACVMTIIAGSAAGLHHAHDRAGNDGRPLGIVHRDVSPSNLMVSYEGNVKVVDFGVAKAADREVKTRSGTVKGKISYLSPEQCRGLHVDRRSDLFSLGIVMWEMLTGARLYRRASDFENMTAIVNELPTPPSSQRPEVPRSFDEIAIRLLAKSAGDRFQTAGEVVEAIENASLRAGTILSSSAVSRLIRDLFGTRAEPWLEIDGDTLPCKAVTLGTKPVPQGFIRTAIDPVEAELAAVLDLSSSSISIDQPDAAVPSRPPAPAANPIAPPERPSTPLAAQDQRSASPAPAAPPAAIPAPPPATTPANPSSFAVAAPNASTLLGVVNQAAPRSEAAAKTARAGATALPPATTPPRDLAVLEPAGPSAPTLRLELEPRTVAAPTVSSPATPATPARERARPALSGASPATALPGRQRRSSGMTRRLVVLCVVGAIVGGVAAWLWTRTSEEPAPAGAVVHTIEDARTGLVATAQPDAAIPAEPHDANEIEHSSAESRDANEAIDTTEIEIPPEPASGQPVPGDASPAAHKPSRSTRPRTSAVSPPADAALPSPVFDDSHPGAATSPKEPASTAAGSGETRQPAHSPDRPSPDKLTDFFQKEQYATVVRMCSDTEMTSSIATVCVLAACYVRASDKARSWLPVIPREKQAAMTARCEQLGALQRPTGTGSAAATGSGSTSQ